MNFSAGPSNKNWENRAAIVNAAHPTSSAANARRTVTEIIRQKHESVKNKAFQNAYENARTIFPEGDELNYLQYKPLQNAIDPVWSSDVNFQNRLYNALSAMQKSVITLQSTKTRNNTHKSARRTRKYRK